MNRESESDFQTWLVDLARVTGWKAYHTLHSKGSDAGFPDWVLAKPGCLIFLELKTEKGVLTLEQADWMNILVPHGKSHGGSYVQAFVVRPHNRDFLEQLLGLERA